MSQQKLLVQVGKALDRLGIAWVTTGSIVSSIQGEPRATHDVDLVVQFAARQQKEFCNQFQSPEFYLSEAAISQAIQTQGMFNLLHISSGDKVDFWLLKDSDFDRSRFARRRTFEIEPGSCIWITSPEDTIIQKLYWAQESGGSEKQFNDALRVYEMQFQNLDQAYMTTWTQQVAVVEEWQRLQEVAKPLK
jgi:hypothetical protein